MHWVYLVSQGAPSVGGPTDGVRDSLSTGCHCVERDQIHDPDLTDTMPFGHSSPLAGDTSVSWYCSRRFKREFT